MRNPLNHHGEEGTTATIVATALEAAIEDRAMASLRQSGIEVICEVNHTSKADPYNVWPY